MGCCIDGGAEEDLLSFWDALLMIEINKIYCEDCLKTMARMPNQCCDIFTDPIYNVGKEYGPYKDNLKEADYIEFIEKVLIEIKRIGINITIYIPKKHNRLFWNILGDDYQEIIMTFNPAGAIRRGFSNQFNKLLTNAKPKRSIRNVWVNIPQPGCGYFFKEDNFGNPGYTSFAITDRVIYFLCHNDLIYDPFMGTGTTAIAAIKNDKNFIGSEINSEYIFDIAEKRIKYEMAKMKLDLKY